MEFSLFSKAAWQHHANARGLTILALASTVFFATAQATLIAPIQDPKAMQLLQQCFAAMGSPPSDFGVLATGTIQDSDHPAFPARPITLKAVGRHKLSREEVFDDGLHVLTADGSRTKMKRNQSSQSLSPFEAMFPAPELVPALNCRADDERAGQNIAYIGQEQRAGATVDHIQFTFAGATTKLNGPFISAAQLDLYIESTTHILFAFGKEVYSPTANENHRSMELRFSDYRKVDGVLVSSRIERYMRGQSMNVITLNDIQQIHSALSRDFQQ